MTAYRVRYNGADAYVVDVYVHGEFEAHRAFTSARVAHEWGYVTHEDWVTAGAVSAYSRCATA